MFVPSSIALLALARGIAAAIVTVDWSVDWIDASPDGYSRPVIGINGQWPCPVLQASVGDTIIVNMYNNLGNETTGMHWHGIGQYGSPEMDGSPAATQCDIAPGSSFTYQFTVCIMLLHASWIGGHQN